MVEFDYDHDQDNLSRKNSRRSNPTRSTRSSITQFWRWSVSPACAVALWGAPAQ